jgi:KaiC/GvpD/RAD55 family RecA-like ATPase
MEKDIELKKKEISDIKDIIDPLTEEFTDTKVVDEENFSEEQIPKVEKKDLDETKISKPTRISTGIPGLDDILQGGFVPHSTVLISGEAGTGKTIFCTQFIWNALCMGENGVYVTLQQSPDEIKNDVLPFGRDFYSAEVRGQARIIYTDPSEDVKKTVNLILKNVKDINAKRLVVDSVTLIGEQAKDVRRSLTYLVRELKRMGVTTLITSEIEEGTNKVCKFGVEEFIVDGVIVLKCGEDVIGDKPRSLYIKKMRRTKHDLNYHPFEITDRGIRIIR